MDTLNERAGWRRPHHETNLADALEALRKLARRSHYYCEDSWYSCPKAEDGSANDAKGNDCDCGADDHNANVELVFAEAMRIASVEDTAYVGPDARVYGDARVSGNARVYGDARVLGKVYLTAVHQTTDEEA